jgi:hypothetical protein
LASGSDQHRDFQLPAVQRSQVFSTSQRLAPPDTVPALFHAGNAPGVYPSRGFPSLESERLPTPAPLLTLPPGSHSTSNGKPPSASLSPLGRLQGFDPPASPFIQSSVLPSPRSRSSRGFLPSKGLPDSAMGPPSRTLLSRTSDSGSPRCRSSSIRLRPVPQSLTHATCGLSSRPPEGARSDCRPSWVLFPFHSSQL